MTKLHDRGSAELELPDDLAGATASVFDAANALRLFLDERHGYELALSDNRARMNALDYAIDRLFEDLIRNADHANLMAEALRQEGVNIDADHLLRLRPHAVAAE